MDERGPDPGRQGPVAHGEGVDPECLLDAVLAFVDPVNAAVLMTTSGRVSARTSRTSFGFRVRRMPDNKEGGRALLSERPERSDPELSVGADQDNFHDRNCRHFIRPKAMPNEKKGREMRLPAFMSSSPF